jgi:hypothetical protein
VHGRSHTVAHGVYPLGPDAWHAALGTIPFRSLPARSNLSGSMRCGGITRRYHTAVAVRCPSPPLPPIFPLPHSQLWC